METIIIEKRYKNDSFTQEAMDGLKWCLKARSKDATRPIINHILVDDSLVIATDGSRVHLFLLTDITLPNGEYEIAAVNAKQIILRKLDETSLCSGDGLAAPLVLYDNDCRAAIVMPLRNK